MVVWLLQHLVGVCRAVQVRWQHLGGLPGLEGCQVPLEVVLGPLVASLLVLLDPCPAPWGVSQEVLAVLVLAAPALDPALVVVRLLPVLGC